MGAIVGLLHLFAGVKTFFLLWVSSPPSLSVKLQISTCFRPTICSCFFQSVFFGVTFTQKGIHPKLVPCYFENSPTELRHQQVTRTKMLFLPNFYNPYRKLLLESEFSGGKDHLIPRTCHCVIVSNYPIDAYSL